MRDVIRKVMVFGVFDGIHEGHRTMLKEAKSLGDYLIVVVAQNHIVEHLKGHQPKIDLAQRFAHLQEVDGVDEVIIGDAEISTWQVVKKHRPDIIGIGYDQKLLKEDLEKHLPELGYTPEIKMLNAYEPNICHSSLRGE